MVGGGEIGEGRGGDGDGGGGGGKGVQDVCWRVVLGLLPDCPVLLLWEQVGCCGAVGVETAGWVLSGFGCGVGLSSYLC